MNKKDRRDWTIAIIGALQSAMEEEGFETSAEMEYRIAATIFDALPGECNYVPAEPRKVPTL